jgi:hypothetical protein
MTALARSHRGHCRERCSGRKRNRPRHSSRRTTRQQEPLSSLGRPRAFGFGFDRLITGLERVALMRLLLCISHAAWGWSVIQSKRFPVAGVFPTRVGMVRSCSLRRGSRYGNAGCPPGPSEVIGRAEAKETNGATKGCFVSMSRFLPIEGNEEAKFSRQVHIPSRSS